MTRLLKYAEAIREAQEQLLESDPSVYLLGLGVPSPTGVFGTTQGLVDRFGPDRVLDLPAAESGMTGMALGSAIMGMRPIMIHQRVDFAVLSMEPIVNQAAKWHYMYGGSSSAPLTVRMIIGRGWGQGPQHSQSLQAWFAHVPGLKVVMPATPADAKKLLVAAVLDPAPVIFLEHRWLYDIVGPVEQDLSPGIIGESQVVRAGDDITLVGCSYMTLECLRAAEVLADHGIQAEVIDLRTIAPLDFQTVRKSVSRTGRLVVTDTGHVNFGVTAEILARTVECGVVLKSPPARLGLPQAPTPTTPALADEYYPRAIDVIQAVSRQLGLGSHPDWLVDPDSDLPRDQPNRNFTGPY
jgi:pyruvate/2-oxoglutarate/acetoin dehydrogenase E1 component